MAGVESIKDFRGIRDKFIRGQFTGEGIAFMIFGGALLFEAVRMKRKIDQTSGTWNLSPEEQEKGYGELLGRAVGVLLGGAFLMAVPKISDLIPKGIRRLQVARGEEPTPRPKVINLTNFSSN